MAERKRRRLRENGGSRAPQESFTQVGLIRAVNLLARN